jgi:tetratricopeptide (TPR) repeat protein
MTPGTCQDRAIRVFISSTFHDMQDERDVLMKFTFPRLRKLCEDRGVTFTEVDLRWGITEEQSQRGEVLPICLAEIEHCRPFFIGLLGERYGWVPQEIPDELIQLQPWLAEHRQKSVTELEILHGVLNNPDMANRAIFYFRDPAWLQQIPPQRRPDFLEVDPVRQGRLAAMKERIKTSELACRVNYPDPATLGQWVLEDLTVAINQMYPPEEAPSPLDRDAAEHEAFARSRAVVEVRPGVFSGVYIGRPEYFARLDEHAAGDGPPLVVLGDSGLGKSALLANWALRYRREHPDVLVLLHFIGATPYSADWAAMLRRVMGELKRHFAIEQEIPDKPDALRIAFANALTMAATRGRAVMVLDALNQLEDCDGAPDLVWLPPVVPGNMRLVLSTLPGRPLVDLQKRQWPTVTVTPLEPAERRTLIVDYLAQYTKRLSPAQVQRIAGARQAANPLYLRALLDELRVFGLYEFLDRRIDYYLVATDVPDLYNRILERWEADYEQDRAHLVRDAMTVLWAARRGLAESELLELLGAGSQPLPRATWSPLSLAAGQSLAVRSGLTGFSHDYLREAVRRRYLPDEPSEQQAHLRLGDYFEARELGRRRIDELPWQLAKAAAWQRLFDLLSNLPFFQAAWTADEFEVKAYWARIEAHSPLRVLDGYRSVLDAPEHQKDANLLWRLGVLLNDAGHPQEAYSLREYLVSYFRETGDRANLPGALTALGLIVDARGNMDRAMALHKEAEEISRELGDRESLHCSLNNQANILFTRGDLAGAMALHKEVEQISRELGSTKGIRCSVNNQANILYVRGDLDGAMALHKDQERMCRSLGMMDGLSSALGGQALILHDRGDLHGAMDLHKEQEKICREIGDWSGLQVSLHSQANIHYFCGDLDAANTLFKESERICRELGDKEGVSKSLNNQANIHVDRGDLETAIVLAKEAEAICRQVGDKRGLTATLTTQALICYHRSDLDIAMRLFKESERVCRELGDKGGLQGSLGNQAAILRARHDFEGAMRLREEQERLCRELGYKDGLSRAILGQAVILNDQGHADRAMQVYQEHEQLCRELGETDGLWHNLYGQAHLLLFQADDPGGAQAKCEEAIRILEETHVRPEYLASARTLLSLIKGRLRG